MFSTPGSVSREAALKIVQEYCEILDGAGPAFGSVADVSELPYSKYVIKKAIATCMSGKTDSALSERLKTAYLSLADWQEGVGDQHLELTLLKARVSEDFGGTVGARRRPGSVNMDRLNIMVVDEWQQLESELKTKGVELP